MNHVLELILSALVGALLIIVAYQRKKNTSLQEDIKAHGERRAALAKKVRETRDKAGLETINKAIRESNDAIGYNASDSGADTGSDGPVSGPDDTQP